MGQEPGTDKEAVKGSLTQEAKAHLTKIVWMFWEEKIQNEEQLDQAQNAATKELAMHNEKQLKRANDEATKEL